MKVKLIFICLGLYCLISVHGKSSPLYTINQGLSHNNITYLYKDSRGLLWIGTPDGLNVYDGYNFKTYYHDPDNKHSISDNYIRHITEDPQGNLWISTNRGVNKYIYSKDQFNTLSFEFKIDGQPSQFEHQVIYSVNIDVNDSRTIWIRSLSRLFKYDQSSGSIAYYQLPGKEGYNIYRKPYNTIIQDANGILYTLVDDGILSVNKDTSTFINLSNILPLVNDQILEDVRLLAVRFDGLFFSYKNVIYRLDLTSHNLSEWYRFPHGLEFCMVNAHHDVIAMSPDRYTVAPLSELESTQWVSIDLNNNIVNMVEYDHSGIIWVGTDKGLMKLDTKEDPFDSKVGYGQEITTIYEDDEHIYLGQLEQGIIKYDKNFNRINHELEGRTVHEITTYNDLMFAATNKGVMVKPGGYPEWMNISDYYHFQVNTILQSDVIHDIAVDSYGNAWFGTRQGLYHINHQEDKLYEYQYFFDGTDTTSFNAVYVIYPSEQENELCLGTGEGFMIFKKDAEYYESFQSILNDNTFQWHNNSVYNIHQDTTGIYWLGTPNGLYKFNRDRKQFHRYSTENGLQNHYIASMVADDTGNLWLGTHKGIIRFNKQTYAVNNFGLTDGLGDLLFQRNVVHKNSNNRIYFGGNNITYFNPDSVSLNDRTPQTILRSFITYLDGQQMHRNVQVGDTVYLTHRHDNFIVELAADDFTDPEKNQFLYSFEPENGIAKWQSTGFQNLAIVPKSDPGTYTFRAKASNNHGVWDETGIWLTIKVETPIWLTTMAYFIYFILFIALVYVIFLYRTRQLRKANRIYKERELIASEVAHQKEELSLKNKNITASINYAKRIQQAMMPSEKLFKNILPNSFILHKPKDIVSGDFYWVSKVDNRIYVAAVDCTGHGVPGAFMSIIGIELFRKITNTPGYSEPGEILDKLNEDFATIFKDVENITLRDGMDIALCIMDQNKKMIEYAGAFNPMYIIRDNRIIEIKGDRFSIGLDESDFGAHRFRNNQLKIENGDMLYLFSDGYADQFGGPEGKKFKYRRFRHLLLSLHHLPLEEQRDFLERSIIEWKGDQDQVDDILVIGVKL